MRILITGGTVFVSKFTAAYFVKKGHQVYVLNRGTRKQADGVHLITGDRNCLGDQLKQFSFDAVIDVCAYCREDVKNLLDALGEVKDYLLISSSAVYPETNAQPFTEEQKTGFNRIWTSYGEGKAEAEKYLRNVFPDAWILRPPYLYGPMQNIYREPFVFDCAMQKRKFYIPKDGRMKLQFFHVEDLCRLMEIILKTHPKEHILNVGNPETVDINTFVEMCYEIAGEELFKVYVTDQDNWRDYFCFYDYEYELDVSKQKKLLPETKDLYEGLKESYDYYLAHPNDVNKKAYMKFIDGHIC